ncbi:MAG: prolyl oligopeptidase family serine peptidase [Brevundimonas sp.]|jgi:dipeptidyl aminopeptidase/acylaminoacyl peptidase|uniref:prolyl oligopeptidase family serine peptidase n=1 Tax=Brevundimonas sp. TaxID=1871086 RepID=UPI0025BC9A16|nr:prolyl oligopeptidase family serine peptidase [Brevundimonas sp.]MCH4267378.1 prolyl oligopeptidase family serine peptidase [Brevundimonas sp.]
MSSFCIRLGWAVIALACWGAPVCAQVRPLDIDDVLSMESFGVVSMAPGGDMIVYERRGPYDSAPRYDLGHRSVWTIADLVVVDLKTKGEPQRLLPSEQGAGLILGSWSPSGRRLLVYRLAGDRLEAGIADPKARTVRWTGLTPDMPFSGSHAGWRDDDRLLLTTRPDGSLPWMLRHDGASQAQTERRWRLMAEGDQSSATVVGTLGGVSSAQTRPGSLQLVEIDAGRPGSAARLLARGEILDVAVSPDGRRVAVLEAGDAIAADPDHVLAHGMRRRSRLNLVDVETGVVTASPTADVALHLLRWSGGSDAVLVWARGDGEAWREGGLRRIDIHGVETSYGQGALSALPEGGDIDELRGVQADWLGEVPVLRAREAGGERFDWYALVAGQAPRALTAAIQAPPDRLAAVMDESLLMFADGALWKAELETGLTRLSAPDARLADGGYIDGMQALRLRINNAPRRNWAVGRLGEGGGLIMDATGKEQAFSTRPMRGASVLSAASETSVVALIRDQGAETLWLSGGDVDRLIDAVNADFAARAFARPIPVEHRDRFGREARSWLTLPVGLPVREVKGVVVNLYPGSVSNDAHIDPRVLLYGIRAPLLAAAGYAVLSPAMPESPDDAAGGAGYVASVDLAVDAALKAEPDLPKDRIAILGHSFGGTAALAIAARTNRYRSYVAWSAVTDLYGIWGEFDPVSRAVPEEGLSLQAQMGWVESGQGETGGPPSGARDRYEAGSPYFLAQDIRSPVLLITGDRDFVPMSQSERIFTALHRQGRPARLVTYWGEGHFNWSPANIRDLYRQILSWLDQTLAEDATVMTQSIAVPPIPAPRTPGPP